MKSYQTLYCVICQSVWCRICTTQIFSNTPVKTSIVAKCKYLSAPSVSNQSIATCTQMDSDT